MSGKDNQFEQFLNSESFDDEIISDIVEAKLDIPRGSYKVKLVLVTPATKPNDNYLGLVLRIKIKIELCDTKKCEAIDVIGKFSADSLASFDEFSVYNREKFVYENVLKRFEELWLEEAGERVVFGPKILKFVDGIGQLIVLEDLKAENFIMMERKEGLSLDLTKTFLSLLAKFHAAGAVTYKKEGTLNDCLDRNCPSAPKGDMDNPMSQVFVRMLKEFIDNLRNYDDLKCYADKIEKWDKVLFATGGLYGSRVMDCGLQVLNHGDVWTNNMMFKLNSNVVQMIDFQLCFWGSPCYDLLSFLSLSVHDDIKVAHFDDFIEFYYQEFSESLRKLKYEHHIPSFDEFKKDVMDTGFILSGYMPYLFFAKSQKGFSFETLMTETDEKVLNEIYTSLYNEELYIKGIKIWLPFLNERGFLDTLIIN